MMGTLRLDRHGYQSDSLEQWGHNYHWKQVVIGNSKSKPRIFTHCRQMTRNKGQANN